MQMSVASGLTMVIDTTIDVEVQATSVWRICFCTGSQAGSEAEDCWIITIKAGVFQLVSKKLCVLKIWWKDRVLQLGILAPESF